MFIKQLLFCVLLIIGYFGESLSNWHGWGWGYAHVHGPEPWTNNHGYKWGNKKAHVHFERHGHPAKCHGWGWNQKCHGGDDWFKYGVHQEHDHGKKHHGWGWH